MDEFEWPEMGEWVWAEKSGEVGYRETTGEHVQVWRGHPRGDQQVEGVSVYVEQVWTRADGGQATAHTPTIALDMAGADYRALSVDDARALRIILSEAIQEADDLSA